jgi:transcription elongation GreA/GreB family factor
MSKKTAAIDIAKTSAAFFKNSVAHPAGKPQTKNAASKAALPVSEEELLLDELSILDEGIPGGVADRILLAQADVAGAAGGITSDTAAAAGAGASGAGTSATTTAAVTATATTGATGVGVMGAIAATAAVGAVAAMAGGDDGEGSGGTTGTAPTITSNGGGATAAVSVAENTTAVTTVTATDPDAGTTLTYSIVGGADAAKFNINPATGVLSFVSAPDFETPTDANGDNVYDVTVQVSDGTHTDSQAIAVTVTNVNEPPVITSNGGGATAAVSVAENGTAVTTVTATDPDAGTTLTYSIVGGADAAKFNINPATGVLSFVSAPDFETPTDANGDNVYDVTVQVSDGTHTDSQAIAVTVTGVNEFPPVITSDGGDATAAVSVAENTTAVTTVIATNPDAGETLTYSIVGGADAAKFNINPATGVLSFVSAPDFETPTDAGADNVYDVTVQVSDGTHTDTQAIAVTVTNVNEPPVITSDGGGATAAVSVAENGTAVTTVTATNPDAGETLTYSIVGGADQAKFTIDPATGALSFVAAPDFETPTDAGADNVYDVTVQVSDGTHTDTQAIAVTVTNVNEPPVLDLAAASDTGVSNTDNITKDNTPSFFVTGEAGATVTLFNDSNGNGVVDPGESLGSTTLTGTSGMITSSVFGDGVYDKLKVIQTDAAGNTSPASAAHAPVTIDTRAPNLIGTTFTNTANAQITLSFDEAVAATGGSVGVHLSKNPSEANGFSGTPMTITAISGMPGSTVTLTTNTTLAGTDHVRLRYDPAMGDDVIDLAGNMLPAGESFMGGSGDNVIDLDEYGTIYPVVMRGNAGNDQLTGTWDDDIIVDGGGADRLAGGPGADRIRLVEDGVIPYARDIVHIGWWESIYPDFDWVMGSLTNPIPSGFDVSSPDITKHDVLSLPSRRIAPNAADVDGIDAGIFARHSISSGIISFKTAAGTPILVNDANAEAALAYLSANITGFGSTVAFEIDTDGNGSADSLAVFQSHGTVPLLGGFNLMDTVLLLEGVTGATLGKSAGANVVHLQDETPPFPMWYALTSNGIVFNFTEIAHATTSLALTMQKNGSGPVLSPTNIVDSGTAAPKVEYGTTLADTDWALFTYAGTTVTNSVRDEEDNPFVVPEPVSFALGGNGDNTIDLSALSEGYEIDGRGGRDIIIGSSGEDYIRGGAGADTMTSGPGLDHFTFAQGDSPGVTVNLGANGILDNGDTFTFTGGLADRITDFASGESINLEAHPLGVFSGMPDIAKMAFTPANGLAADQAYFMVRGNYNGTTTFTVNDSGADTLVVYDGDYTSAVTQTAFVLSGVTPTNLSAGYGYISHL